jgi:hypothetical protein
MTISLVFGLFVFAALVVFFYRAAKMDIGGSVFAALIASAVLALLTAAAIYAGELFR